MFARGWGFKINCIKWLEFLRNHLLIFNIMANGFVSVDNFNIYPNTRLGKLVKAKRLEEILDLCDDFCPGQPQEFFFDRLELPPTPSSPY